MTYEEFMTTPFKYGGNGEEYLLKDELPNLNRRTRRWIAQELKKGRQPHFEDIISYQQGEL